MRQQIKDIVLLGGLVQFSYKKSIPDWYNEIKITHVTYPEYQYIVSHPYKGHEEFGLDIDKAVDYFMSEAFAKSNVALAYQGIDKYKLRTEEDGDWDDMSVERIRYLVKKYRDKYYESDYAGILAEIHTNSDGAVAVHDS